VDGDGKLDIIVDNLSTTLVSIFRNTSIVGSISFASHVNITVDNDPRGIALGDLDGDGKPDLAAGSLTNNVSVFRNTSVVNSVSFAPKVSFTTGATPTEVAIVDIDGDDRPEILTSNEGDDNFSVYHNIADPPAISSFTPTSGHVSKSVTVTGANFDTTPANNTLYFGATKANVTAATATSLTVEAPLGATFEPLHLEVSGRTAFSDKFYLPTYEGTSTIDASTLAAKVDFTTGTTPQPLAIGDMDGDGKPDLVISNDPDIVSVLRNTSSTGVINGSSFAAKVDVATASSPSGLDLGDLDGDGKLDVAIANNLSTSVSLYRNLSNSGSISLSAKVDHTTGTQPTDVAIGDVDADGKADVAVSNLSSNNVSVLRNISVEGTIDANSLVAKQDYATATSPQGVALADIDGDGKPDLLVPGFGTNQLSVLRNTSTAGTVDASSFAAKVDFATASIPAGVITADIDGDTKPDVIVPNFSSTSVSVFRNTVTSGIDGTSLAAKVDYTLGTSPIAAAVGDLDGDGKIDLAVASQGSDFVSVLRNQAISGTINAASLATRVDYTTGDQPSGAAIGDLDGDGRSDLVVTNKNDNDLSIFRNQAALKTTSLAGTSTLAPGAEVQLFRIGLASYGTYTLNSIAMNLSDLSTATGITSSDLDLRLYKSADETFDSGDSQIGIQSTINFAGTTTVTPTATETPLNHSFYIVTARISTAPIDKHAFKLGFTLGGVTTSVGSEGSAIAASDANNVTIDVVATQWAFTSQPTAATHLQEMTPTPGMEAQDASGNIDRDINGNVTLTVNPSGYVSQSTIAAVEGKAPTANLTVSGAGEGRTLTISGLGLPDVTTPAFDIAKADATVTLNNLNAQFDGTAKAGGANTVPSGLPIAFSYNQFNIPVAEAPTGPGVFGVTATVSDPNFQGSAIGTLTITAPAPPVAALDVAPAQGNPPLSVTFTDRSTGSIGAWFLEPKADGGRVFEDLSSPVTVTYSTPGTHTVFFTVSGAGGSSRLEKTVTVNSPPIVGAIGAASANEDENLVLDLSTLDPTTGTWSVSGTDGSLIAVAAVEMDAITFTPVANISGSDVVTITRTSSNGLSSSQEVTLTWTAVDDPPAIVDLAGSFSAAEEETIHVGGSGNASDIDSDTGSFVWSASGCDGGLVAVAAGGTGGVDFAPVADAHGETNATITLTDPVSGATASQAVTLTWSSVNDAPSSPVAGFPANGATEVPLAPLISWSGADADNDVLVYDLALGLAGSAATVSSGQTGTTFSASGLAPGTTYEWKVVARDPAGASAEASFTFTTEADLRGPVISAVGVAATESSATFGWDTDEPSTSLVKLVPDGEAAAKVVATAQQVAVPVEVASNELVTRHQLMASDLAPGTSYSYEVSSTDARGNSSELFTGRVLTLAAPDRVAPMYLVDPYVEGVTQQSAVVRWRTDEQGDSRVMYATVAAAKASATNQASGGEIVLDELVEEHSVRLGDLVPDTEYSFQVRSQDAAGNLSDARGGSFSTDAAADLTAPEFTSGPAASSVTDVSAVVVLRADELVTAEIRFDTDDNLNDGRLAAASQAQTEHSIELTGLEAATTYSFQVAIRDEGGNEHLSGLRSFTTLPAPDAVPPLFLAGPVIEGLGDLSAVLVLTANEPVRLQVVLSSEPNLDGATLKANNELQLTHTVQLTNLEPDTEYFFEVAIRDGSNNETPPVRGRFLTLAEEDTTPPQIVELFAEGVGFERATVVWRTSELTTGFLEFSIEAAAKIAAATESGRIQLTDPAREHRVQLTNLEPGSRYGLHIVMRDAQGNTGERSGFIQTLLEEDLLPPLIETGPAVQGITTSGALVAVTYNEPVELSLRYSTQSDLSGASVISVVERKRPHSVELTGLEPGTVYHVGLAARDRAGNSSDPHLVSFETAADADLTPPNFTTLPFATDIGSASARVLWSLDEPGDGQLVFSASSDLSGETVQRQLSRQQDHAFDLTNLQPETDYFYQATSVDGSGNSSSSSTSSFRTLVEQVHPVQITAGPTLLRADNTSATIFVRLDRAAEAQILYWPAASPNLSRTEDRGLATEHNVVLTNLEPGTGYQYTVTAGGTTDASGDFATEAESDTEAPEFLGPPVVADRQHDRARIEWKTNEMADSEVRFNLAGGDERQVVVSDDARDHGVVLTNLEPGSRYSYRASSTDPAGNRTQGPQSSFETPAGPDLTPPDITGRPIVRGVTHNSVILALSTNEPTTTTVRSADGSVSVASGALQTDHEIRLVNLEPGRSYDLTLCVIDASGNGPTCTSGFAVATQALPDTDAPRINTGPIAVSTTIGGAVIELTTDEPAHLRIDYAGEGRSGSAADPEFRTAHRMVLTGLLAGTTYGYAATVTDVAGNQSSSSSQSFDTRTEADRQAPTITAGPSFQAINAQGVTIVWDTDEPSSSIVDFEAAAGAAKAATTEQQSRQLEGRVERGDLVQNHRITLADLQRGTIYNVVVTSNDLAGNRVSTDPSGTELHSQEHRFTTRGNADNEPPVFAVNPTVDWTNATAVVAWGTNERASSRVDWRGGGRSGFVENNALVREHSRTVTGLIPRTGYRFMITSVDRAGNTLTWGSIDGLLKPIEGAAKILQPPGGGGFFVTDNVADSFVRFGITSQVDEVVGAAQDVQTHTVTLTNLEAGQPYHYKVQSTDPSGNGAAESIVAVTATAAEIDLVPPRFLTDPAVEASTDQEIVLGWRTDEAGAARIEYQAADGERLTRNVEARQATQQINLANLEPDTEYDLSIYVSDASQNEIPEPFLLSVRTDAEPDLELPRILSGPEVEAIADRGATVVWTTDELSDSYVDYDSKPYLGAVVGVPLYTRDHRVTLTKLDAGSTYFFRVGSTDRANNGPAVSDVLSFVTLEGADETPPEVPTGFEVVAGATSNLLQWTANEEQDLAGYSVFRETDQGVFEAVASQLQEPRYLDEGLESGRTYRYRITAIDRETPPNESEPNEIAEGTPDDENVAGAPAILGLEQGATLSRPILVIQNAIPVSAPDELNYTVQVSTASTFRSIVARGGNIAEGFGGMTRWRVSKALTTTRSYWWRARAFDGRFESAWSRPVRLRPNQASIPLTSEDFDGDGAVSFSDFFILANGFGSGDPILDLDRNGKVGIGDLSQFKTQFGKQVASKLLFSQGAEVAAGSIIDVDAEVTEANQVRLRLQFAGVPRLSGYGLSVYAEPPVLRYLGRVDSSAVLAPDRSLSLVHEAGATLSLADHLKGRVAGVDLEEGSTLELLFALDGPPQNVQLFVQEGFLGRGAGRAWRVEHLGSARVLPTAYALYPNYPNPFNPSTVIPVGIPEVAASRRLELRLFNLLGQVIRRWDMDG
jgi:PKD repeat protein